jgi:hypothetical protein
VDEDLDQRVLWGDVPKAVEMGLGTPRVCSPRSFLTVDEIAATIEGAESTTPITEARFKEWVEIWKKCIMLGQGFRDMEISLSQNIQTMP